MRLEQCPTCGHKHSLARQVRCPRCNTLLLQPCGGSCSKCKKQGDCGGTKENLRNN